jgi:hypothetical protein
VALCVMRDPDSAAELVRSRRTMSPLQRVSGFSELASLSPFKILGAGFIPACALFAAAKHSEDSVAYSRNETFREYGKYFQKLCRLSDLSWRFIGVRKT